MINKIVTTVKNNKTKIYRRALILGGTFVGIVIAAALVTKIDDEPDVIVVEETVETVENEEE